MVNRARRPERTRPSFLLFLATATAVFLLVYGLGFFYPASSQVTAGERLRDLYAGLESAAARALGRQAPERELAPKPPAAAPETRAAARYSVQQGDTLLAIATRHGVPLSQLIAHNGIRDADTLTAGDVLVIPGRATAAAATAPAAQAPAAVSADRAGEREPLRIQAWSGDAVSWTRERLAPWRAPEAPAAVSSGPPVRARAEAGASSPGAPPRAAAGGAAEGEPGPAPFADPAASDEPVEAFLALAEREIAEARFEEALRTAQTIERLLATGLGASTPSETRARLEVVRATAYLALGNHDQVQQALQRALAAQPGLELDPANTTPKLLRALEAARVEPAG